MARVDGWIDAETGARLVGVLDELEPPDPVDGPEPPRSLGQRRADALAKLVVAGHAPRAGVAVVVDVDTISGPLSR